MNDPGKYKRVRRVNDKFGPGIDAIFGVTEDGKAEVLSIRFDKTKFTVKEAKKWLDEHDYEPIEFEPASDADEEKTVKVKVKLVDVTSEKLKKISGGELFLAHRALHAMKPTEAVVAAHKEIVTELKRRGMKHLTPLKLSNVKKQRDLVLIPDYVSIVGSAVSRNWEDARDFNILVRDDIDQPKYWDESVFTLVKHLLDPGDTGKGLHLSFNPQGPHDGPYVPVFDLVLREADNEAHLVKAVSLRFTLMGVGSTRMLRYKPAGLLIEHAGRRIMLDGGEANPPKGNLDAWLVTDDHSASIAKIRKLAEDRGVEAMVGVFYADSTTIEPRLIHGAAGDAWGYLITTDGRKVAWAPSFKEFPGWADGADLMFAEAASWDMVTTIAEQAKERGVKRLVFAHIGRSTLRALDKGETASFGEFGRDGDTFLVRSAAMARVGRPMQKGTAELKVAVLEVAKVDDGYIYLCGLRVPEGSELAALEELDGKPVFPLGKTIASKTQLAETGDTLTVEIMGLTLHRDGTVIWSKPIPLALDKDHDPHTLEQAIARCRRFGVLTETSEKFSKGVADLATGFVGRVLSDTEINSLFAHLPADVEEQSFLEVNRLVRMWIDDVLNSGKQPATKAMPRRDKCMNCVATPTVEVLWAEGRGHAWFCDDCYAVWKKENGDDVNAEQRITDGEASQGWPARKAASILAKMIRREGDKWVIYDRTGTKKLGEFDTEEEAKAHLREIEQQGGNEEPRVMASCAGETCELYTKFIKAEDEKHYTFGILYKATDEQLEDPDFDAHGEAVTGDVLQDAQWQYVRSNDRNIYLQHGLVTGGMKVIGEWVDIVSWPFEVTIKMKLPGGSAKTHVIPANSVFMGVVWNELGWKLIKAGKLRGYSMGGVARRKKFPE